jgi:NADH-quinone oxidoreductase subunit F
VTLRKVLTERWGIADSHKLAVAEKHGAYEALKKVLRDKVPPAQVIAEVKASGLRGRGGAGFPTGQKWSFVPQNTGKPIYLCVNADESEPGTNKDREIMERDPHQLIEGSILASYAINAKIAFLYIRGEFDLPLRRMQDAAAEARKAGYVGKNILGSGVDCDFLIHRGAGAYICGEETALLSSLEGNRGEPKIKPPFPAVKGAFGCPTIVNNVESIAAVPWIMRNGAAAYSAMGTEKSKGTKVISVSGRVKKPGNYEIELGYPLKKLLFEDCGGMQDGYRLKAVIPGGSSVPVIRADVVDKVNLDYESCQSSGTLLGSAGLIVIDDKQDMPHLLTVLARFYSHESCGQCTPCREGTGWAYRILQKIEAGEGTPRDLETLKSIATGMSGATICFLADSLAMPIQSFLKNFPEEFEAKVKKAVPA